MKNRQKGTVTVVTDGVDWLSVPDAARPPVLPVDPPPDVVDGFRFARTADGSNDDGSPHISPERGYVTDPEERDRLLAYLAGGATLVDNLVRGPDLIDPTRQLAVPATFRTDGTWVWPGSVEYYLRRHHVAPEPALRERITGHGHRCPPVDGATAARARAAVDTRAGLIQERVDAYRAAHPDLRPGDPDRFPGYVDDALVGLGWARGRDIRPEVDDWLARNGTGIPGYEPFPAALAAMREFGGLTSIANGPGQTSAQCPFTIYPTPSGELVGFAPDVQALGERLGLRTFQIGEVEQGVGALVVDEIGRAFLVGPMELYAGATIDEALIRMLEGLRCEELHEIGL